MNNYDLLMYQTLYREQYHFRFLEHRLYSNYEGMMFHKHHYLYKSFNEKIQQLTTEGFIQHWLKKWILHRIILEKPLPPAAEKLNLEQLSVGFQIWLIGISFTAFTCELLRYWAPKIYYLKYFEELL